jgi:AraC-like DNA-binding protein
MTNALRPAQLTLARGEARLIERLAQLNTELDVTGDRQTWLEYAQLLAALAAIAPATMPGSLGELITTQQLAERVGLSPKTVLRRMKQQGVEPVRFAKRGPGALRWAAR